MRLSAVFIHGLGAVSPGGWGCPALRLAMRRNTPLPTTNLARPGWDNSLTVRAVPPPATTPAFLAHPRLRRTGELAQHTIAAALEALGGDVARVQAGQLRLGIVVCLLTGVVGYSRRFFEEVLRNPAGASPVLFPETVFNAPASHLGAYLNAKTVNYTLVGDEGTFLQGLALAAQWLAADQVDGCVVVGAEELDWLVPDALRVLSPGTVHGSGAGAVYLHGNPTGAIAKLSALTDAFSFAKNLPRAAAAQKMRAQLPAGNPGELLCLSRRNHLAFDAAENSAWADWTADRQAPRPIFGEAFVAAAAWQCVLAIAAVGDGTAAAANVSIVGSSQQAIGARFGPRPLISRNAPGENPPAGK